MLKQAPDTPDTEETELGEPEARAGFTLPSYRFARPLSDPLGGTKRNKGRHPAKMADPKPSNDAPEWTPIFLLGYLQLMDSLPQHRWEWSLGITREPQTWESRYSSKSSKKRFGPYRRCSADDL